MNRLAPFTLPLLALALAALVLVELLVPFGHGAPPPEAPATPLPAEAPALETPESTARAVATLLARPLFSPSRRPQGGEETAAAGQPVDLPRLSGILVSPGGRQAIFQPDGGKPVTAGEGDMVAGWRVQEIAGGTVLLIGPGGSQRVEPRFDAKGLQGGLQGGSGGPRPVSSIGPPITAPAPDIAAGRRARVPFMPPRRSPPGQMPGAAQHPLTNPGRSP